MLFVCVSIPLVMMVLLIEKRARFPIVFMLIGIFVSVFASELNGFLKNVLAMDMYSIVVTVTPITEEVLKALPVLYYAVVISDKKEKLFTAAMALGIGFAVLENAYYLINSESFNMLKAVVRAFGAGLMHGMCTLLVGVGISFVKKKRKLFVVGTFGLLSTAIVYHGIYNILIQSDIIMIQSDFSIVGALLPIATYIPFLVWRLRTKHRKTAKHPSLFN